MSSTAGATAPLVECRGLHAGYGSVAVVQDVDLQVMPGEIVALLGPNGAGKTTTMLTIAGELPPLSGEVSVLGDGSRRPLFRRARAGVALVTEERSVFMGLSTADNLRLGGVSFDTAVGMFPELEPLMKRRAGLLSGGQQQMLTLARALGRSPRLLLADELSLGLAPLVVERILDVVRAAANDHGVGVLLVEQHIKRALDIADRALVMRRGRIVLSGTPAEIRDQIGDVQSVYLAGAAPNAPSKEH